MSGKRGGKFSKPTRGGRSSNLILLYLNLEAEIFIDDGLKMDRWEEVL